MEMANPHNSMLSFQEGLILGALDIYPVSGFQDLYCYMDEPTPGEPRLTYVRLTHDQRWVTAFVSCLMNGFVDESPCISVGYAVPEELRNQGRAKSILEDVISDQLVNARDAGHKSVYIEAVADVTNIGSQRVAEAILGGNQEEMIDVASGRPAYRYTAQFDTYSGLKI